MRTVYPIALIVAGLLLCALPQAALAQSEPGPKAEEAPGSQAEDSDGPDQAGPKETYESLTQQAAKAYKAKKYEESLGLFEKAYAAKPVPNLLYNMGRIHEKLGHFEAAIDHYERFATKPGVENRARKDALDRLETLRQVVQLRQEGEDIDKEQVEEKHSDRALAAPDQPTTVTERDYTLAYLTLGTALVADGASGVFALQARTANEDFATADSLDGRRDAASRGQTASIVADSMLGLGVVMTGLGVYFLVSPPEHEVSRQQAAVRIGPQLGASSAGMRLRVDW